jgi:1,4-alpha-glucan branching enzyme
VTLPEGSWGQGEHHYIWLNQETEWTWKHIYDDELRMKRLAASFSGSPSGNPLLKRAVAQAMRELLLLQASDWQFLISTVSARDYAELRFSEHHQDFNRTAGLAETLLEGEEAGSGEIEFLENCEERDNLFPDADSSLYLDK